MTDITANDRWYTRCPVLSPSGAAAQPGWVDDEFARESIARRLVPGPAE